MTILITGSSGFIGYHLTKRLLKSKINIIGIDNLNSYYDINLKKSRLKEIDVDVICFQEIKANKDQFDDDLFIKLGY